ncbi:hypothetical protein D3C72_1761100 [compost metagenome]
MAAGGRFGRNALPGAVVQDQQTPLRAGLLDRGTHQRVDQLVQEDFARHRLRDRDHRGEVQVFDRCADRPRRSRCWLFLAECRI